MFGIGSEAELISNPIHQHRQESPNVHGMNAPATKTIEEGKVGEL
jgi:hypothetical protein